MYYYEVAPKMIVRSDSTVLTYASDIALKIGQIVLIEVGRKQTVGVVLKKVNKPTYKTKNIIEIIEEQPLPPQLIKLAKWMAEYYQTHLAIVLQMVLPSGLNKKRRPLADEPTIAHRERTNNVLNTEQKAVVKVLDKDEPGTYLLQGVTGSGKTEIYIDQVRKTLAKGKSAIIMVPEISLTPQIVAEFSHHFDNILITHSKMTEARRHLVWREALNAVNPQLVIGPRSALFLPLHNLGLIILDEAHEPSYKQEQSPRYSALRAATMLGRFLDIKVIFGSATPSIADRFVAESANKSILKLDNRANLESKPAIVDLVDMKVRDNFSRHRFLSNQLLDQITESLEQKRQVLIFHNRRGSASTTLCEECGWTAKCPSDLLPLALHGDRHQLLCHVCGFKDKVPTNCPVCGSVDIIHKGIGTKLIESELVKLFSEARIARFDADNEAKETLETRYHDLYSGDIDIAIGTQIVAKGLDLPKLRVVGVIQADAGLAIPDYSTDERVFQLLAQVVGRVGRNQLSTHVVVQTYQPTHPSVVYGLDQNYEAFYEYGLNERRRGNFPPFKYLLKLTCKYKTESASVRNAIMLAKTLRANLPKSVQVLGPTPAFYEFNHGSFHWQIVLKSDRRAYLMEALQKYLPAQNWSFELDPTSLL